MFKLLFYIVQLKLCNNLEICDQKKKKKYIEHVHNMVFMSVQIEML